jgi:hypothetical protein
MRKIIRMVLLILAFVGLILSIGCSPPKHEGFAIYLTQDNISVDKMPALNQIKIADTPLITLSDIVSYNFSTYQLTLTAEASNLISNLVVPTSGLSFVVCINRKPVYWGVFWSQASSAFAPTSCVIVSYPEIGQMDEHTLELDYYGDNDPRNNPEILKSLEQDGKLITGTTTSITSPTTSTTMTTSNNSDSVSSGSNNGLNLTLSLDETTYQPGQSVSITIDEKNLLSTTNSVRATGYLPTELTEATGFTNEPSSLRFGLVVFQGNYSVSNYSTATPLIIYDPGNEYIGTQVIGPSSCSFQPLSDFTVVEGGSCSSSNGYSKMQYELQLNGSWSGYPPGDVLNNFNSGVYTVVAGDEWGNLVVVHFTVS